MLILALFTGFGNMPLWKRYYIADIPGFSWSGNFLVNVNIHYITGSILLFIALYFLTAYLMLKKKGLSLTPSGKIHGTLLGAALVTGLVMAIKNFPGVDFPLPVLVFFNLAHMASACFFMFFAIGCAVMRKRWLLS